MIQFFFQKISKFTARIYFRSYIIKFISDNKSLPFLAPYLILTLIPAGCYAREVSRQDVASLSRSILHIRADDLETVQEFVKENPHPTYAQAFMLGYLHKKKGEYKSAILWYARAYFEDTGRQSNKFFPGPVLAHVKTSFKTRSPMADEVLFNLADLISIMVRIFQSMPMICPSIWYLMRMVRDMPTCIF